MSKAPQTNMMVNIAGVVLVLFMGTYAANSFFSDAQVEPCATRYPVATELSLLGSGGTPSTAIELQAQFGREERGILDNLDIVTSDNAPSPALLQVKLYKAGKQDETAGPSGVAFQWAPAGMKPQKAVCLSYSVLLPKTFQFAQGGVLPGLYGGERLDPTNSDAKNGAIVSLLKWRKEGSAGIQAHISGENNGHWMGVDADYQFPRGRWVPVQQEVVLNVPGKPNGIMRLWIDGELQAERDNVVWRHDKNLEIEGVAGDAAYLTGKTELDLEKTQAVRISPFSLRWK